MAGNYTHREVVFALFLFTCVLVSCLILLQAKKYKSATWLFSVIYILPVGLWSIRFAWYTDYRFLPKINKFVCIGLLLCIYFHMLKEILTSKLSQYMFFKFKWLFTVELFVWFIIVCYCSAHQLQSKEAFSAISTYVASRLESTAEIQNDEEENKEEEAEYTWVVNADCDKIANIEVKLKDSQTFGNLLEAVHNKLISINDATLVDYPMLVKFGSNTKWHKFSPDTATAKTEAIAIDRHKEIREDALHIQTKLANFRKDSEYKVNVELNILSREIATQYIM